MKIIPVYLRDMQDAKHLVQAAEACKKEVDLLCGRYVVDANQCWACLTFDCLRRIRTDEKPCTTSIAPKLQR